jgi:hypothetical protein
MQINFTIQWWFLPTIITLVGVVWATLWVGRNDRGIFAGFANVFALLPVLVVSCISWIISGVLK